MPLTWSNEQDNSQPLPKRKNGTNSNMSINKQIQQVNAAGKFLLSESFRNQRNSRKGYQFSSNKQKPFWKRCTNALTCSSSPNNIENPRLYGPLPKIPTPNATGPSSLSVRNYPPVTPEKNLGKYYHIGKKLRPNIPVQPTTPLNNNYTRAKTLRHSNNSTRNVSSNSVVLPNLKGFSIYKNFGGSSKRSGSSKRRGSRRSRSSKRRVTRKSRR